MDRQDRQFSKLEHIVKKSKGALACICNTEHVGKICLSCLSACPQRLPICLLTRQNGSDRQSACPSRLLVRACPLPV